MDHIVPIRVAIGLVTSKGRVLHKYPDFNAIRDSVSSWTDGSDWSHFIDRFGEWHYDNVAGHQDDDSSNGSPRGVWIGMLCVPDDFAAASVERFPDQVSIMDESECQAFYEGRCTVNQPEILEDTSVLQSIAAKKSLGIDDPSDAKSLDPDHPQRGRRRNKLKTWAGYKQQRGIEIDAAAIARLRNNSQR